MQQVHAYKIEHHSVWLGFVVLPTRAFQHRAVTSSQTACVLFVRPSVCGLYRVFFHDADCAYGA